ncbi:MAG: response regulator [Bacillus sp. (in: Bacteria)]|nr:response regulator [Bacillus sp. (in: firmicutes)]
MIKRYVRAKKDGFTVGSLELRISKRRGRNLVDDLSILVCDDSQLVRQQMIDTLLTIGVSEIFEASDGDEAISICRDKRPGLVFMDIIMPNKDGIAALKEIQHIDPEIKVVMASSTSGLAHLKKVKTARCLYLY